jgi:hypothetical protein
MDAAAIRVALPDAFRHHWLRRCAGARQTGKRDEQQC